MNQRTELSISRRANSQVKLGKYNQKIILLLSEKVDDILLPQKKEPATKWEEGLKLRK